MPQASCEDFPEHVGRLGQSTADKRDVFEIRVRYDIKDGETFTMNPGYRNFQLIRKHEHLASTQSGRILSSMRGRIFMPLYQAQGNDGYFIIRKIPGFVLRLSALVRQWQSHKFLIWLPGITWHDQQRHTLNVNLGIARFLTKPVFHLLGYRSRKQSERTLIMSQREYMSKADAYRAAPWNGGRRALVHE